MVESSSVPVAVITGGTEGVGRELAREFAQAGHDVLLVARTQKTLEETADTLARETGQKIHMAALDIAGDNGPESLVALLDDRKLYAEYLVNNAAIGDSGPFAEGSPGKLAHLVDLNVRALTDLTRRLLPGMIERDSGGVLNVASLAGMLPGPYQAAYYASKAYVISLSEALAHEVSGTNVRVAVLVPGPVKTRFHELMDAHNDYYIRFLGLMGAEQVARVGYRNFMCGQKVIVPGFFNMLVAVSLRVMPHTLLIPFAAWLLTKRDEPDNA
jgi:short-subunit dehydrogenase